MEIIIYEDEEYFIEKGEVKCIKNIDKIEDLMSDYLKMSIKDLKEVCREKGINTSGKKLKKDFIELLTSTDESNDSYTEDVLKEQYLTHKQYYKTRKESADRLNVDFRLSGIPEDISENVIKFILHYKLDDKTSTWSCKGDLISKKEGVQECKCFTSNGPLSFTPSGDWDVIYFLDARNWLNDIFVLYKISLKKSSDDWKNINVSKTQTFEEQCIQGRRPRITWDSLYPQIENFCEKVYEGSFDNIFTR